MDTQADLLIYNIGELTSLALPQGRPHKGDEMSDLGVIPGGVVAVADGEIAALGRIEEVCAAVKIGPSTRMLDAIGKLVTPGLVDAHTHLVFAGSREDEFVMKVVDGLSYEEIERRGGGICQTIAATRSAGSNHLLQQARDVIHRMLRNGTTTLEAKSGYALNLPGEMRLLEIMHLLDAEGPIEIVPTFFGTHDIPREYIDNKDQYLKLVMEEMLPAVAQRSLARFCDSGTAYSPEQTAALLSTAQTHGLAAKIHADEFYVAGGAELAAETGAVSAEHCIYSTDEGIEAMVERSVIAVLLPAVPLVHKTPKSTDARRFIDRGAAVALGTDFNPSCPMESMPLVMSLGCYMAGMSPAEALTASTINAAYAVGCGDRIGSLEPGKEADIVVWKVDNHKELIERLGGHLVDTVIKGGRVVLTRENI